MRTNNNKGAIFVLSLMVMMILVTLSSVFIYRAVTEKNLSDRIFSKLEELCANLKTGKVTPQQACSQIEDLLVEVHYIASDFKLS